MCQSVLLNHSYPFQKALDCVCVFKFLLFPATRSRVPVLTLKTWIHFDLIFFFNAECERGTQFSQTTRSQAGDLCCVERWLNRRPGGIHDLQSSMVSALILALISFSDGLGHRRLRQISLDAHFWYQHHLLERLSFPQGFLPEPLPRTKSQKSEGLILSLLFKWTMYLFLLGCRFCFSVSVI